VSGLGRERSHTLLMRRPDAATWHIARDVSQRAEPDVRPLGNVVSAFIAEKTFHMSIPLTDDVPPQHLICPVHSAGRRRPGHPAGDVPVQSIVKQYTRAARCTVSVITYTLPEKLPCTPMLRGSRMSGRKKIAPATNISCSSITPVMFLGPQVGAQYPCTCPP
jgi:hypothetical protein